MSPISLEPLVSELYDLRNQIDHIVADARKLTTNVSERQFNWRVEAGRWSMAQCLGRLNAAGAWLLPRIDGGIQEARERGLLSNGPYRHGFIGNYFIRLTEPPAKQRFKAPKVMAPPDAERPEKTISEFFALQDRIRDRILSANGLDLGRAKVESPIARWLQFTLGQTLALVAAHQRRHLWQAWQIRNDPRYPVR